jgi:hypothetical protein
MLKKFNKRIKVKSSGKIKSYIQRERELWFIALALPWSWGNFCLLDFKKKKNKKKKKIIQVINCLKFPKTHVGLTANCQFTPGAEQGSKSWQSYSASWSEKWWGTRTLKKTTSKCLEKKTPLWNWGKWLAVLFNVHAWIWGKMTCGPLLNFF